MNSYLSVLKCNNNYIKTCFENIKFITRMTTKVNLASLYNFVFSCDFSLMEEWKHTLSK